MLFDLLVPFSADDLLKSVKYASTELPQRGGIKDYAPDGTWLQAKKIESFYRDHKEALTEERVKKVYVYIFIYTST